MINFFLALLHHKWRQVEKNAYYIFQVLKTTSEVRPPVLLKFVMRRPAKKKLRTMSRADSSKIKGFETAPYKALGTHTSWHYQQLPLNHEDHLETLSALIQQ